MTKTGPWSTEEAALLRRYADAGYRTDDVARELGRPSMAIRAKANRMGVRFGGGGRGVRGVKPRGRQPSAPRLLTSDELR